MDIDKYIKHFGATTFFVRGPLSNWWGHGINTGDGGFYYDDRYYNCVEQFMMAQKAAVFDDWDAFDMIMTREHPKDQKDWGRRVKNYDDKKWAEHRYDIVLTGIVCKFTQNPYILPCLLDHGPYFAEAAPWDKIWGIGHGLEELDDRNYERLLFDGENLLGKALTEARKSLICLKNGQDILRRQD